MSDPLRIVTWLAPGIPARLFESVTDHLQEALGRTCSLRCESRHSGPITVRDDVFADNRADLGFLCAPSYLWLRRRKPPSVALVPAAPVSDDSRAGGRPEYFCEVLVRQDDPALRFEQLAGRRFAYNDRSSLSGYFSLWKRVADAGWDGSFFGSWHDSGSHKSSIEAILDDTVDAAAVDANVLSRWCASHPELAPRIRALETLGPFPIQPVVLRAALADSMLEPVATALHSLSSTRLSGTGVQRFVSIDPLSYDEELDLLRLFELLPPGDQWLDPS